MDQSLDLFFHGTIGDDIVTIGIVAFNKSGIAALWAWYSN